MDFRLLNTPIDGLSKTACDALLIVVSGEPAGQRLDAPLAALLADALACGDLVAKAGRTLYLHRPAGVKAARLVFSMAADGSAKAFKAAAMAGLAQIKPLGVKHLAVATAGPSLEAAVVVDKRRARAAAN